MEYLKHIGALGGDCNNELAGLLCFGLLGLEDEVDTMKVRAGGVWHLAYVWQGADWDYLPSFFQKKFGAEGMRWKRVD